MTQDNVVFISYKSEDRELIKPYLNMLSENGIEYWWDQHISGSWGKEIELALANSKLVLGFVTENSMKSGPVFAEFRRAGSHDKLIPIRLDKSPYTYEFETILGFLNYFDLSPSEKYDKNSNPELQRLIDRVKNRISPGEASLHFSERKLVKTVGYDAWFDDPKKLSLFPYLLSLCIFRGQVHERIQHHSDLLQKTLIDYGFNSELFGFEKIIKKSSKLDIVGAEVRTFQSDFLPYPTERIEFLDPDFKDQFLDYVWREMDQLNGPIIRWFQALISLEYGNDNLNRVALALSIIGRKHFNSVYVNIIWRWLRSNNQVEVDCADLTLSLMTSDEAILEFVKKSIDELTNDSRDNFSFDIAMRLGCGYTGISLPDVAISLMRRVENTLVDVNTDMKDNVRLTTSIKNNVKRLVAKANEDRYALVAAKNFIRNLMEWINQPIEHRISYLPCYIAMTLFECTIVLDQAEVDDSKNPALGLKKLFTDSEEIDRLSVEYVATIFNSILTEMNAYYREKVIKILDAWCTVGTTMKKRGEDHEYFVVFVTRLFEISKTSNDRERVAHAVRKFLILEV